MAYEIAIRDPIDSDVESSFLLFARACGKPGHLREGLLPALAAAP